MSVKEFDSIDVNNVDPAYWEEILKKSGLSTNKGLNKRRLIFVGTSMKLDAVASAHAMKLKTGHKTQGPFRPLEDDPD